LLSGYQFNEFAEFVMKDAPAVSDVTIERVGLVLSQDINAAQSRIDAVAQGEIDQPVYASEGDSRLGPVKGKGIKSFSLAPHQQHRQNVSHSSLPVRFRTRIKGGKSFD
jgi:hypothetical protein